MKIWYLQYRSVDGNWYDSGSFSNLEDAKRVYGEYLVHRKLYYRVIERTDKVVWPIDIDPATQLGA